MELMIGRVIKPHGIRGEVAVEITTDDPEGRFAVGEILTGRQGTKETRLTVASSRPHQNRLLLTFREIPDRTAAETLRGMRFFAAPRDEGDGFYDHDLEGLEVHQDGAKIGSVTGVMHAPAGLILEARLDDTGKDVLIPFVEEIVPEVDLSMGRIVVTPPEGLFDL